MLQTEIDRGAVHASGGIFTQLSEIVDRSKSRIDFIDSLRGVAVLLVFFTHSTEIIYAGTSSALGSILLKLGFDLNLGRVGVVLFFAISGFVIPYTLKKSHDHGLQEFLISRVMRLYPAFLVSVIPSAAAHYWMAGQHFSAQSVLFNFTMFPRAFGVEMANGGYWTLETEAIFYTVCAVLFIGRSDRLPFIYTLLSIAGLAGFMSSQPGWFSNILSADFKPEVYFAFSFLSIMCWSAVLRKWWDGQDIDVISKINIVLIPALWCGYESYVLAKAYWTHNFLDVDQRLILGYSIPLAIFLSGILLTRIHWKPIIWLGRISYSFYLLHAPAVLLTVYIMSYIPFSFPGQLHVCEVLSFALAVGVSTVLFLYVEEPSIAFGRRIAKRLRTR